MLLAMMAVMMVGGCVVVVGLSTTHASHHDDKRHTCVAEPTAMPMASSMRFLAATVTVDGVWKCVWRFMCGEWGVDCYYH